VQIVNMQQAVPSTFSDLVEWGQIFRVKCLIWNG